MTFGDAFLIAAVTNFVFGLRYVIMDIRFVYLNRYYTALRLCLTLSMVIPFAWVILVPHAILTALERRVERKIWFFMPRQSKSYRKA